MINFASLFSKKIKKIRYERKYLTPKVNLKRLIIALKLHPQGFYFPYPARQISNLYLDTLDYQHLQDSLGGQKNRVKYRLRWYHTINPKNYQFEIKYKSNELIYKKIYKLASIKKIDFSKPASWQKGLKNCPSYLAEILKTHAPVLYNCYNRQYLATLDNHIRLTIDTNLSSWPFLNCQSSQNKTFQPQQKSVVLELKYQPYWEQQAEDLVSRLPLVITKHSKYVQGFLANII